MAELRETSTTFYRDLIEDAKNGRLDDVIGRDDVIMRVIQILSRRTKNNPCLLGSPGVGKTAVVEGLSQRIAQNDVSESLMNSKILSLDVGALMAGTKYQGELENRIKQLIEKIVNSKETYILFIDEVHNLVGLGRTQSTLDFSNILKPYLARGELRVIGATTYPEYRSTIGKDAALERRFQPIHIEEPSIDETIAILRGLRIKYESFHRVQITDKALVSAAKLSSQFLTERYQPDKSIDLVDEAASRLRIEIDSKPVEIDKKERLLKRLSMEIMALEKSSNDEEAKKALVEITKKKEEFQEVYDTLNARWEKEKKLLNRIGTIKRQIENKKSEAAKNEHLGNYEASSRLTYDEIPKLEKELNEIKMPKDVMVGDAVGVENIKRVVSAWTHIPMELMRNENEVLLKLEEELSKNIIGQDEAIQCFADTIRRSRVSLNDPNKPIGSFLLLGATGVGKTALTLEIASLLFAGKYIRLDMSEYSEYHETAKLFGAPPGYVGYESGGQLTEYVRTNRYCTILLDEIEKANKSIFNSLLQLMDAGRLTDGMGNVVDFKNTLVIMTSNLGAEVLQDSNSETLTLDERAKILGKVKSFFSPEFINRLDDIIIFNKLSYENVYKIAALSLEKYLANATAMHNIKFEVDELVLKYLADVGQDSVYGVRPLKRLIEHEVGDALAKLILRNRDSLEKVKISFENEELVLEKVV
jgi:ATP-dependent Clp protease ATP-binding subunit ClpB